MKPYTTLSAFLFILLTTYTLSAQVTNGETTYSAETIEIDGRRAGFDIGGAVDVYYQHNFNDNPFPVNFVEHVNTFAVGMANVIFSREGKFGFTADLAAGTRSEAVIGYSGSTLAFIKQLFVSYAPSDRVNITFGNFGTYIGYESFEATGNVNYSSSYLFSYGPYYHTGVKADFVLSDKFSAMAGVFNDTDEKIDDIPGKHIGVQVSYENNGHSISLNYLRGKEDENGQRKLIGHVVDVTARFAVTDQIGLGLNTLINKRNGHSRPDEAWFGTALYAMYVFSETFTLGLRGEYTGDNDGLVSGRENNRILSFTLSGNVQLGPVTLIPEWRIDRSSEDFFPDEGGGVTNTIAGATFAAVYSF